MTRAIVCGFGLALLLGTLVAAQSGDPYFAGDPRGGAASTSGQSTAAAPISVQFLNQRSFEMPVQLHDQEAREIRLFVSANGGRQWQLYNRYRPDAASLPFACRNDGEYWFALYTVNQQNAIYPMPTMFEPMLKLRIDTQRPLLEVEAYPAEAGGLAVRWNATDPHLNAASMKIEYRPKMTQGRELPWRPATMPTPPADTKESYSNSLNTWPETSARVLDVRVSISDWAGNLTESIHEVVLPLVTQGVTRPAVGDANGRDRSALASSQETVQEPTSIPWNSNTTQPSTPAADANHFPRGDSVNQPGMTPSIPVGNRQEASGATEARARAGSNWNSTAPERTFDLTQDENAGRLPTDLRGALPIEQTPLVSMRNAVEDVRARPNGERLASQPTDRELTDEVEELPPPLSGTRTNRPDGGRFVSQPPPEREGTRAITLLNETPGIPTGEVARLTNDDRFRLSYEVESAGPGGVAKVQLWITSDAGQSWKLWTEDPDCESPISVEVPGEGVFGFRLVITARNGLAGEMPQPGELADMWVEVDRTAPVGQFLSAPLGEGIEAGKLIIRWKAEDRNLGRRPITLHFSDSPSGPWEVLTAGLPNTGQYDWRIVPSLPKQVYLKLEVKDRAGNVHFDQLDRPVDLSTLSPRGTLKGFEIN